MKIYREKIKMHDDRLSQLSKLLNRISLLRLFVFILLSILLIYLIKLKLLTTMLIVFPLLAIFCFGAAIKYHSKIAFLKKHTAFLSRINELEILRENGQLEELDAGHQFINPEHPYTSDLDVFGQHSLFQLLNRTTMESGRILLSEWLSEPAAGQEIYDRQDAIQELAPKLDWRQDFQASGLHYQNKRSDYYKLLDWVEVPVVLLKYQGLYVVLAIILAALSLTGLYFSIINLSTSTWYVYLLPFMTVLVINNRILKRVNPIADGIVGMSQENLNTLRGFRILINKIECESFKSKKLHQLQSLLKKTRYSASKEINRLSRLLEFSQQRGMKKMPIGGNHIYSLLNSFLLLDLYLIIGVEKWKSQNKTFLKPWSEVVSEFEVINSFAGFYYSNPSYAFPKVTEKNNFVCFESMGHPLISSPKRVCNPFHSEGYGDIAMITGSNMGGKSTFLRAVGVNLVLALAGAPCCAKSGQISQLKLFSSMRTEDNLKNGISSFYAELSRIENMLKLIESSQNTFFLLDEMFKGTNSEDRHKGGFSLIRQLSKLKTSGIIATHDIELAKLLGFKRLVTNYSFNSEIKNESMHFSYQLHSGVCNDFNASELMRKSGIEILSDISG
jgi:DNA mismatch repair ATPase MutS